MNAGLTPDGQESPPSPPEAVDPLTGDVHVRSSFADEVCSRTPHDIDLVLARIAQDVYRSEDRSRPRIADWRPLSDEECLRVGIDPALRSDRASGFDADLYSDGQGRYVLAYRGTDAGRDWAANLGQGLGLETVQYNRAMALAVEAKVAFGNELVIVGHSLGGGLAVVGAVAANVPAVTFNAAGIKDKTLERAGFDAAAVRQDAEEQGWVRRYAVGNEILTELQENNLATRYLLPDAIGRKIELTDPDPLSVWQRLNPARAIGHSLKIHGMDSVIRAMERELGRGSGEIDLMSHLDHPFHTHYQRIFDQVHPKFVDFGHSLREAQNVAGALVLEAERSGVVTERVMIVGYLVYAYEVSSPDTNRFTRFEMSRDVRFIRIEMRRAAQVPLAESSRRVLELFRLQPLQGGTQSA